MPAYATIVTKGVVVVVEAAESAAKRSLVPDAAHVAIIVSTTRKQ